MVRCHKLWHTFIDPVYPSTAPCTERVSRGTVPAATGAQPPRGELPEEGALHAPPSPPTAEALPRRSGAARVGGAHRPPPSTTSATMAALILACCAGKSCQTQHISIPSPIWGRTPSGLATGSGGQPWPPTQRRTASRSTQHGSAPTCAARCGGRDSELCPSRGGWVRECSPKDLSANPCGTVPSSQPPWAPQGCDHWPPRPA